MSNPNTLAGLLRKVEPLHTGLTINDVAERLLQPEFKGFLSLPVVDGEGRPLGLVSRYRLQDIFMQRFGRDLWGGHPVQHAANAESLVVAMDTPLDRAASIITAQVQYPITEDFILVDADGCYRGLGTRLEQLPAITCTPSQINQVLLNLLTNATQAMEQPGKILIRSWADKDQVHLSLQDNGRGMPKEVQ